MATPAGTIVFWIAHDDGEWWSNDQGYKFPELHAAGVHLTATKEPDQTIELTFAGLSDDVLVFRHPVPTCGTRGLMVVITWTPKEIILYLNGQAVETRPAKVELRGTRGPRR